MTMSWNAANYRHLMDALAAMHALLQAKINKAGDFSSSKTQPDFSFCEREAKSTIDEPPALEKLCKKFHLSNFERDVLLLCAGMELDSSWASL